MIVALAVVVAVVVFWVIVMSVIAVIAVIAVIVMMTVLLAAGRGAGILQGKRDTMGGVGNGLAPEIKLLLIEVW